MHPRTVRRKKLFRAISGEMGTAGKRPLEVSTRPSIQARFHPHSEKGAKAGYPLYQIFHELAKLPRETIANFVDVNAVSRELKKSPAISRLLARHPELENAFNASLENAIKERGIKGSKFWINAPKEYIDKIAWGAKGKPSVMNDYLGKIARRYFGDSVKPRTLLDIGTFAGGTIKGVVQNLSPEQRRQLKIVAYFLFVSGRHLWPTARLISRKFTRL